MKDNTILVIGNKGKTGARVQQRLEQQGCKTRGVSRSSTPSFDWNNRATWDGALAGATAAYVSYQPDLAVPEAEETIRAFLDSAKAAGIQHIVLLSGRGEDGAQRAERVLQTSGLIWNVVRASWFAQNFSEGFMLGGILSGEMKLPASNIREPFVDVDDIADVAMAALTQPQLHNKLFEVTGPRAITFEECLHAISSAIGHDIQYMPVSVDAYINELKALGLPDDIQWLMRELFTVVFDGRNTPVAHGVEEALGRPATDFNEYVKKTLASGVWKLPITQSA